MNSFLFVGILIGYKCYVSYRYQTKYIKFKEYEAKKYKKRNKIKEIHTK